MGLRNDVASNFITQIFLVLTSFIINILIVRQLGPYDYGYAIHYLNIISIVATYGHLGINNSNLFFLKRRHIHIESVMSTNVISFLVITFIYTGLFLIFKYYGIVIADYSYSLILFSFLFILSKYVTSTYSQIYTANQQIVKRNKIAIILRSIYLLIIILLVISQVLSSYIYIFVLMLIEVIRLILYKKDLNIKLIYRNKFDIKLLKEKFSYGKYIFIAAICYYLILKSDQFFIYYLLGKEQLGIYSVAVKIAELIGIIQICFRTALVSDIYNKEVGSDKIKKNVLLVIKGSMIFSISTIIPIIIISTLIPFVYGEIFRSAIIPTCIITIGVLLIGLGRSAITVFYSNGKPIMDTYASGVVVVINISLNSILIPAFGMIGAAIATVISYTLYLIIALSLLILKENFRLTEFVLSKKDFVLIFNSVKQLIKKSY